MAELLLEIVSEEIPPAMQESGARQLCERLCAGLKQAGCEAGKAKVFSTVRRIGLCLTGLPDKTPAASEDHRGPRTDAPAKAVEGFRRKYQHAKIREDKGYWFARIEKKPRPLDALLPEMIPQAMKEIVWPKSMRWPQSDMRWVRPVRSILCLFDGAPVRFAAAGVEAGGETSGHRFMAPKPFPVSSFADYREKMRKAKVLIDVEEREAKIWEQSRERLDCRLLKEGQVRRLANLTEWPVLLHGQFDDSFRRSLSRDVLDTILWKNQDCLLFKRADNTPAAHFWLCADIEAEDGGGAIVKGTERVVHARLADALFFIAQDKKTGLEELRQRTKNIAFHPKLGSMWDKAERLQALCKAGDKAHHSEATANALKAAKWAKADLASQMVAEYPELQGVIGADYLKSSSKGRPPHLDRVEQAIRDHYLPRGADDRYPAHEEGVLLSVYDKIDALAGLFLIGERPTGSKDPHGLRRAARGLIRLMVEADWKNRTLEEGTRQEAIDYFSTADDARRPEGPEEWLPSLRGCFSEAIRLYRATIPGVCDDDGRAKQACGDLVAFMIERLKVWLREQGGAHDLIDAAAADKGAGNIWLIHARAHALDQFLSMQDGKNLLAAYRRARGILQEVKEGHDSLYGQPPDAHLFEEEAEKELYGRMGEMNFIEMRIHAVNIDFEKAFQQLAQLRPVVDRFFDEVLVNTDNEKLRINRLRLLVGLHGMMNNVADFSKIGRGRS